LPLGCNFAVLVAVTHIACKAGAKLEHSLTKCGVAGCTWVATGVLLSGRLCLEQVQVASCYVKVGFLELGGWMSILRSIVSSAEACAMSGVCVYKGCSHVGGSVYWLRLAFPGFCEWCGHQSQCLWQCAMGATMSVWK